MEVPVVVLKGVALQMVFALALGLVSLSQSGFVLGGTT